MSATGELSEDGKTLTLTAAGATYFDGTYALTIADSVKTKDNKETIKAYAGTLSVSDKAVPTVTNAVYDTITNEVVVTLSEPIVGAPDVVRLNGSPIVASFVADSNNTKIKFSKPANVAAGSTGTVYVAGAVDYNGNILTPYTGSVVFTNDASDLQVTSVTQQGSNVAKIVFNKSIASNNTVIDGAISVVLDGNVLTAAEVDAVLDTNDTSKKTVLVTINKAATTAPDYFYGTNSSKSLTFIFADATITDVFGKKLPATTQNVVMTKDATGPKVVSAKLGTVDGTIEVLFDENIDATGNTANIVLRKDGVALKTAATAARKGATGEAAKTLVITAHTDDLVGGKLPAGAYTVRLNEGAIKDTHTNDNALQNVTAQKAASTTDLKVSGVVTAAGHNVFEVTYSEDVTTASALNLGNYTLDGAALPAKTDIYFKNGAANRTVVIELPADSINIGNTGTPANARLAIGGVQSTTGKTVLSTSYTVTVIDNTAAVLQGAKLIGANILQLTFNEALANGTTFADVTDILDDISIAAGSTAFVAGNATHTASVSGKDLIITITPGTSNWGTVTSATNVTVKTLAGGDADIKDANGVNVKSNVSVSLTK